MISRMKYINRWGLMRCTRNETLAEHTLETAMLTHALVEIGNAQFMRALDAGQAIRIALYHDCAEIITGDLPTPVKYHDLSIRVAYHSIERQATKRLKAMLPDALRPAFASCLDPDKAEKETYGPYIKAADKLSALIKCTEELRAGNMEFQAASKTILAHPALELPEAQIFIKEYLPAYALSLDEVEHFGKADSIPF
ncbi:MAG: 5'-deoxynucleotidase [Candidatus Fimivivens sp.]